MSNGEYKFEIETQKKILALLFQDFTYLSTNGTEVVKPEYFDSVYLRNVAKWIINYFNTYNARPTNSVLFTELDNYAQKVRVSESDREQYEELINSLSAITIDDSQYLKDQTLEFARSVAFRDALEESFQLYENDGNYEKAIAIMENALSVGSGDNLGLSLTACVTDLPDMLKDTYDRKNLFTTGIKTWDKALGGGCAKGEVHCCCLTGETLIKTNQGFFEIKDLVDNFNDKKAYSINENSEVFETTIYRVWKTRDTSELIELLFDNNFIIRCTPDHKFRVTNPRFGDESIIWSEGVPYKKAEDILESDEFSLMKLVNKKKIHLDHEVPVYNMTVDNKYHNFELSHCFFSKNCGRPGAGKSKLLSYLAYQAIYQKRPTVYFTFEWSEKEVLSNIMSCITGLSMQDLIDPAKREEYTMKAAKIKTFAPQLRTKYFSNKTVSINEMRTYLTKLYTVEGFKPGLIIIDYADLMLPAKETRRSSDSTYEEMGLIFYDLKRLADIFECPVFTASQLNKAAWNVQDDSTITQDMLADSSRKAHIAYSITTLNQNDNERAANKMRLYTAKSRKGITGETVYIDFNKSNNQVHECEKYDPKTVVPEV